LSLDSPILFKATNKTNKTHLVKEKRIMAVVKVSGKVSKVFGASNQGLSLVESYKSATGEDYTRTWTVWFAVAHDVPVESEVTVFGQLSTKIEDYEDRNGKPSRKVKLDINNAQIDKPVAPVASAPF
jgi:hypothetical protein